VFSPAFVPQQRDCCFTPKPLQLHFKTATLFGLGIGLPQREELGRMMMMMDHQGITGLQLPDLNPLPPPPPSSFAAAALPPPSAAGGEGIRMNNRVSMPLTPLPHLAAPPNGWMDGWMMFSLSLLSLICVFLPHA